ncbi:MAG: PKD domain-containing protein, partial [Bacteroidetes bacterium]|nr:PKD domain-containing protein [Bacteroidota bacterium]
MKHNVHIYDSTTIPTPTPNPQIVAAEYFLDDDPGVGNGIPLTITPGNEIDELAAIPTTGMSHGAHIMYIRTKDTDDTWSLTMDTHFFLYDSTYRDLRKTQPEIIAAEYFFDTDPGPGNGTLIPFNSADSINKNRSLPIDSLPVGSHYVYIRTLDDDGTWSIPIHEQFDVHFVTCICPIPYFTFDTVDIGSSTVFTNLSDSLAPGVTYEWDINYNSTVDYTTKDISHSFAQRGIYEVMLTVNNSDSCYASMIQEIPVSQLVDTTLTITGDIAFCEGDSVILSVPSGYPYYKWTNGDTTNSITIKTGGAYKVRIKNQWGLQADSRTVEVIVYELPTYELLTIDATGGNTNGSAVLTLSGGTSDYNYLWSTGDTLPIVNNLAAGVYSVTFDDGRCPQDTTFTISNDPVLPGDLLAAEYFFDTDPGVGNATPFNIAAGDTVYFPTYIPLTSLSVGYHHLFIRTRDTYGSWSVYLDKIFNIYDTVTSNIPDQAPIAAAEYFFDEDPGIGNGTALIITMADSISENKTIPVTGLDPGYHSLFIRTKDLFGKWSLYRESRFEIYGVDGNLVKNLPEIYRAEYFFDNDPGIGNGTPLSFNSGDSVNVNRSLPVAGLSTGFHWVYIRAMDDWGQWSITQRQQFEVIDYGCTCAVPNFTLDTVDFGNTTTFTNLSTG